MIAAPLEESILGQGAREGPLRFACRLTDIREFADGKHRVTDDVPYGGGAGMVMKPEPLVAAIEAPASVGLGRECASLPQGPAAIQPRQRRSWRTTGR